jgi:hypothetical protein
VLQSSESHPAVFFFHHDFDGMYVCVVVWWIILSYISFIYQLYLLAAGSEFQAADSEQFNY